MEQLAPYILEDGSNKDLEIRAITKLKDFLLADTYGAIDLFLEVMEQEKQKSTQEKHTIQPTDYNARAVLVYELVKSACFYLNRTLSDTLREVDLSSQQIDELGKLINFSKYYTTEKNQKIKNRKEFEAELVQHVIDLRKKEAANLESSNSAIELLKQNFPEEKAFELLDGLKSLADSYHDSGLDEANYQVPFLARKIIAVRQKLEKKYAAAVLNDLSVEIYIKLLRNVDYEQKFKVDLAEISYKLGTEKPVHRLATTEELQTLINNAGSTDLGGIRSGTAGRTRTGGNLGDGNSRTNPKGQETWMKGHRED